MPLPSDPQAVVFAVVVATADLTLARRFRGTGFKINNESAVMTARHVFDGADLHHDEIVAAVFSHGEHLSVRPIEDIYLDATFDIAVGKVVGAPTSDFLRMDTAPTKQLNRDILTLEFSSTEENVDIGLELRAMILSPYYRKGHILRAYETSHGHRVATTCLDLSFPALKGASGAPVIWQHNGTVTGMIVGNTERHLMPAQIESITGPNGIVETTRYFLPMGQAIAVNHLAAAIAKADEID